MDFIVEFVFEFVLDGFFHFVKDHQKNRWIRFITGFTLLFVYVTVLVGLTYLASISIQNNLFTGLLVIAMIVFVVVFGVKAYKKQLDIEGTSH